jgi:hypothetical protein
MAVIRNFKPRMFANEPTWNGIVGRELDKALEVLQNQNNADIAIEVATATEQTQIGALVAAGGYAVNVAPISGFVTAGMFVSLLGSGAVAAADARDVDLQAHGMCIGVQTLNGVLYARWIAGGTVIALFPESSSSGKILYLSTTPGLSIASDSDPNPDKQFLQVVGMWFPSAVAGTARVDVRIAPPFNI